MCISLEKHVFIEYFHILIFYNFLLYRTYFYLNLAVVR
nr:MAG TPA: hypothetical protein [Caudoviricetes sp.]